MSKFWEQFIRENVLNVNECTIDDLCKLNRIGKCIASRIVNERGIKLFESKQDLINRVNGITLSILDEHNKGLFILFYFLLHSMQLINIFDLLHVMI